MKSTLLAIATAMFSLNAMASWVTASQSMTQFCADRSSPTYVKQLIDSSENLMGFANYGGIGNGGVCWWHSRFQRNALYLTIYKPAEQRPTLDEAKIIVEKIRDAKEVIVIPGFRNFAEFSIDYRGTIQRELEKWQKGDGIIKFNWVVGLKGKSEISAEKMKASMDELYRYVEVNGNIAYQKLQIKGVVAHAWLVVNMQKTANGGYDLEVLDSNYANMTNIYHYKPGMKGFNHAAYGNFVPYLERKEEMEKLRTIILNKCGSDSIAKN